MDMVRDETAELLKKLGPIEIEFSAENVKLLLKSIESVTVRMPIDPGFLAVSQHTESCNATFSEFLVPSPSCRHRFNCVLRPFMNNFRFTGSKGAMISLWDTLCRFTIDEYIVQQVLVNRFDDEHVFVDRNKSNYLPDLSVSYRGHLILKGEEEANREDFARALKTLVEQDCDFYADFILCYAAAGPLFQFFVLTSSPRALIPITKQLDLSSVADRLYLVRTSLNIARVILGQTAKLLRVPPKNPIVKQSEYARVEYIENNKVRKIIKSENREKKNPYYSNSVSLWQIVNDTRWRGLFVDCVSLTENSTRSSLDSTIGYTLEIITKRYDPDKRPRSSKELLVATKQVLEALKVLHDHCFAHCDIRWANIVYCAESKRYFLIDFDSCLSFGEKIHDLYTHYSPRILGNGLESTYTAQDDLYQVSRLITDADNIDISDVMRLATLCREIESARWCAEAIAAVERRLKTLS